MKNATSCDIKSITKASIIITILKQSIIGLFSDDLIYKQYISSDMIPYSKDITCEVFVMSGFGAVGSYTREQHCNHINTFYGNKVLVCNTGTMH